MKTPIVTITYRKDDWDVKIPFTSAKYREAYEKMYAIAEARGIFLTRASLHWLTKRGFKKGWTFQDGEWKKVPAFTPDLVWDKTAYRVSAIPIKRKLHGRFHTLNDLKFEQMANDKFLTHLAFQKYTAKTFLVHNRKQAKRVAQQIPSKNIVLKPNVGSGGKSVRIITKAQLSRAKIKPFTLVQQFIDSSQGIPGITSGYHDLRIGVVDGDIIYGYIRKPAGDLRISNVSLGGTMHNVPISKIPKDVIKIVRTVDNFFAPVGGRYYSVDFIYNRKNEPFIVELNSKPGSLMPPEIEERVYTKIIKFFQKHL